MDNILIFLSFLKKLLPILKGLIKNGGKPYVVGGTVRDLVLGCEIKDLDIEVHSICIENLEKVLKKFGKVKLVGKKFGVLRLGGYDIDWSLPRKDTKGRKPKVEIDPTMTIEEACRRRDLTMNAMAIDLSYFVDIDLEKKITKKSLHKIIIDPYGGLKDIQNKKLRVVDKKLFLEDPLRFFRVMQFISRFEMEPDDDLNNLCSKMDLHDITTNKSLAKERIFEEIKKLCLKSKRPSLGFRWLKKIERLKEIFPELYSLVDIQQRKDYHPEGNVFEHTMQSLDATAQFFDFNNDEEKFLIMLGILCHDLGKSVTTDEKLSCIGHCEKGVPICKKFLKRITNNKFLIDAVCKFVLYHTRPGRLLDEKAKPKAYKRLALKLSPQIDMRQLALAALFDLQGRNPKGEEPLIEKYLDRFKEFLQKSQEAQVERGPEKPVLLGRHLLDIMPPGPKMGEILKKAYQIQIDEGIKDIEVLKDRVLREKKINK